MQRMLEQNQLKHALPADLESSTQAVIVKLVMSPLPGQLGSASLLRDQRYSCDEDKEQRSWHNGF